MSCIDRAKLLTDMSENARAAGDVYASLELAIYAAQFLQLARLLKQQADGRDHGMTNGTRQIS